MSKEKPKIIPDKIHLLAVNVFKANIETSDEFLEEPKPVFGFEFGIAKEVSHNVEKGAARFRLFFTMDAHDKDAKSLGLKAEYGIEFHFYVENFSDFVQHTKDGEVQIELSLGGTLMSVAYSTSRGIILERTQGTMFGGVILPVIDPFKILLEEDKTTP